MNFKKNPSNHSRYIFGQNEYAESISKFCDVDGFIDDFNQEITFCGKPIYMTIKISSNSLGIEIK